MTLAALALATGCGDSESAGDAAQPTQFGAAEEPVQTFARRFAKLLETTTAKRDCAQLDEVNRHSMTRFTCPADPALRKSMAKFRVIGAEEYGTGGIVDYRSGKIEDGAAIVLFVAPDRRWGIGRFGVDTKPSTDTDDEQSRAGFQKAVDAYLKAIEDRDCDAFAEVWLTGGQPKQAVCSGAFRGTADLAKRLKANPKARPNYEGGNASYGFFTLETRKPKPANTTISVVKGNTGKSAKYVVLDAAPSPTAADQRRVRRQFEQQRRKQAKQPPPGSMAPSTTSGEKAD